MPQATRTAVLSPVLVFVLLSVPACLPGQAPDTGNGGRSPAAGPSPAGAARIGATDQGDAGIRTPFRGQWESPGGEASKSRFLGPRGPSSLADGRSSGDVIQTGLQTAPLPDRDPPTMEPGKTSATRGTLAAGGEPPPKTLPAPSDEADPLPLAPPGRSGERSKDNANAKPGIGLSSLITVGSSLAVVLGIFFVVAWVMRRTTPGNCPALSSEVFEVLGRAPLAARQQVHLVRLGRKLVLLCISPGGVEALSEVTDPDEVTHLAGLCQRTRPDSATAAFRQVFQRFSQEHPPGRPLEGGRGGLYQGTTGVSASAAGGLEGTDV
jgi:flagellar biogenesis protein FliO